MSNPSFESATTNWVFSTSNMGSLSRTNGIRYHGAYAVTSIAYTYKQNEKYTSTIYQNMTITPPSIGDTVSYSLAMVYGTKDVSQQTYATLNLYAGPDTST